ncbi:hypothetical protein SAMD00023353_1600580 [Rosellinia necatrix]|uniref:Uncharacterized protein n=1 Tax=Rosellinia necatrix TaxID=77044 RepID=A0A1W2TIE2_ROSNE|nr:hypothetical protein SAMD00023353_1600580 [Rosellinia necatrix]
MLSPSPPPPPPPPTVEVAAAPRAPTPPAVSATGPPGAFKLNLLVFNGSPFKDHWAFWIPTSRNPSFGVVIHAVGDVRHGFKFEVKRNLNITLTNQRPTQIIPLQWVDGIFFDEAAMLNNDVYRLDNKPVCAFEDSAYKAPAPTKSLNAVDDVVTPGRPISQRNCQTWIVEAAAHLVRDGIIAKEVADYLNAMKQ